jgi:hypothetical protein
LTKTDSLLAARCAAVASLGAGVIHFAVTPMHWRDWLPSGLFFAALATFQLIWAFVAWSRPGTLVLAAGVAANVGAAALWVSSCIAGPPVGPSAGQPEGVGAAGIMVLLLQCYVVMGSAWAWTRKYQPEEVSGFGRALVLMGANTVMAGAVTVGLAASLQGHHSHHHGGAAEAQVGHEAVHDAQMEGHHHDADPADHADPAVPPSHAPAPAESGLPVTDMGLDIGDDHHAEHVAPPAAVAPQPSSAAVPEELGSPMADMEMEMETDGHHHDHG